MIVLDSQGRRTAEFVAHHADDAARFAAAMTDPARGWHPEPHPNLAEGDVR